MKTLFRGLLAVLGGVIIGSVVNMGLVNAGHWILPIEGMDSMSMETLADVMPNLDFEYFIFPFLAHALGTFVGASVAAWIAVNHKMKYALGVGLFFLMGGIMASTILPAPIWFVIVDLLFAYFPMAWLGGKLTVALTEK